MTCPRHNPVRGFTLVEILIAIGIFSAVVVAIYACWTAVLRSSKVGLEAAARAQRTRMAMQIMEEALTYTRMHVVNADLYWFGGESGSDATLSFIASLPRSFPRGGKFGDMTLRRVEFSLQPGPEYTSQLVLRQAPLLMEFDRDEVEHPYVLAREVQKAVFQFWDMQADDWVDEWTQTNQIPPLVRVSLVMSARKGNRTVEEEFTGLISPAARAVQPLAQGAAARQPDQPGALRPGQPGASGQPVPPGQPVPGQPMIPGQPAPGVPFRR
jgi:type II secretion system protein J